uniref:Secreted protein n=1 Tax=Oryza rufipogon TaxID=4529 RepID=A0A0E0QHU5_ORYRU
MHAASLFFFLTRAGRCLVSSSPPMLDGEERMRVAGDGATWRCSLFYALADGGCLASYVVLLPNKAPHWLPAVGMVDQYAHAHTLRAWLGVRYLVGYRTSKP